jgi:hypothetical protein
MMRMPVIDSITVPIITVIITVMGIITINPIVNTVAQMVMLTIVIMGTEDIISRDIIPVITTTDTIDRDTIHMVTDTINRGITDTSLMIDLVTEVDIVSGMVHLEAI